MPSDSALTTRVLHTADWHLGRQLYGRRRYDEFEAFLSWLVATLKALQVDVLVVAGDIFDTGTPSNRAQELYYQFLCEVAASPCRHVVITAGNHDSPSFLEAPKELLKALRVHVVGTPTNNPASEVLELSSADGSPQLVVAAVPYLRERDLRTVEAGESLADKDLKLAQGLREHYRQVCEVADAQRHALGDIPLLATGHLFTAGGKTVEGDGVRDLYVGSLGLVTSDTFPNEIDYLALGHLHVPQTLGDDPTRRYSGSPIAMGFGEAGQTKSVCLVEFSGRIGKVSLVEVPVFRRLESLRGDWKSLEEQLGKLRAANQPIWVEVIYEGQQPMTDLRSRIDELTANTPVEVLRVKNRLLYDKLLHQVEKESLEELTVDEVFERCLEAHHVASEDRPLLRLSFQEIVIHHADTGVHAEPNQP